MKSIIPGRGGVDPIDPETPIVIGVGASPATENKLPRIPVIRYEREHCSSVLRHNDKVETDCFGRASLAKSVSKKSTGDIISNPTRLQIPQEILPSSLR